MNTWTEINIKINQKDVETAGAIAQMVVPYGIYIEDYSDLQEQVLEIAHIDLIDEELLSKNKDVAIIHIYINPQENPQEAVSFLVERFSAEKIDYEITTDNCEEEDWLNNWKKYFNPIEVGESLLIMPTWRERESAIDRKILNIDPGVAFGTGSHETTKLCLEALEKYIKKDDKLLDIGCGSGILSVGGVLLGAKNAVGVDIDSVAVKTAKENVLLNNFEKEIEIIHGNLTEKISGIYNVIVANIVADAIISLSECVDRFMNKDSLYIMSGIIDTRSDEVLSHLGKFKIIEVIEENGWVCIVAKLNL